MRKSITRYTLGALLALTLPATALLAVDTPATAKPLRMECVDNGADLRVDRGEIVRRAQSWLAGTARDTTVDTVDYQGDRVSYSALDCHTNQYGTYRQDSAGYVAMAWGLGGNGGAWTPSSLRTHSTAIAVDALAPGDALIGADGAAIFMRWTGDGALVYEQSATTGRARVSTWSKEQVAATTPSRAINATNQTISGGDGYLNIVTPGGAIGWYTHNGWLYGGGTFDSVWTGSGFNMFTKIAAEHRTVYGITADGKLRWYRLEANNAFNPQSGAVIGQGWEDTRFLIAAGYGILYRITNSGNLYWYAYHGVPGQGGYFDNLGVGRLIGSGWQQFSQVSAWIGTFYAVRPAGSVHWYGYRHWSDGASYPDSWQEASGGAVIGSGWTSPGCNFRSIGHAGQGRIYGVDGAGVLRQYIHWDWAEPYWPPYWWPSTPCGYAYGPGW
jgi:hypothetical protein